MHRILYIICLGMLFLQCGTSGSQAQSNGHMYTNKLIHETSPYLLQHAHNPVDWHAWDDAALAQAVKEDKLLIISVGYSACHWCHVMEHESFEDTAVAELMNEHFLSIKVDREERPDVDDVYMTACQMLSQRGCGWPLNAIALPNGKPIWAGTYFPKDKWMEVLEYFIKAKKDDPEKLAEYADQVTNGIRTSGLIDSIEGVKAYQASDLDAIALRFIGGMDLQKGGRRGAPKFPMPINHRFLMQYAFETGDKNAKKAVITTIDEMAKGGIYDHLGGGFARYSVDDEWHIPHFEKMLYDNSQLISLYADAYKWTGTPRYKEVIEETIAFMKRELYDQESGAFYSSLDADSEGEEGKFYVWTKDEIASILGITGPNAPFYDYYNITKNGNWEHGNNALRQVKTPMEVAQKHDLPLSKLSELINQQKTTLLEARADRIRPGLDDKVITAWNGLMIKGLIDAYSAVGDKSYLDQALSTANFISDQMMDKDYRLSRNYKNGKVSINGFLDDYGATIEAFTSLYEVTFDEKWLYSAKSLTDYVMAHFFDEERSMFYYTSDIDPPLITRKMELADNVIAGSNSMMANNLYRLGLYFYHTEWIDLSEQMLQNMLPQFSEEGQQPSFYANWCRLLTDKIYPPYEIAIVGSDARTKADEMLAKYLPNKILLGGIDEGTLELLKEKLQDGTFIYVCQNKVCKFPVEEVNMAVELME